MPVFLCIFHLILSMECTMFIFQPDFVRNQSYKLRIRRFSLSIAYCITEKCIDRIHLSAAPCHLDGMTDRSLHTARCSLMFLGNGGIQDLGNRIEHLHIFHRHHDRIPQILISFDMRRHTDFMNNIGNINLQIFFRYFSRSPQIARSPVLSADSFSKLAELFDPV